MKFFLDSSSIIAMARAGRLDLLRRIVGKGWTTAAVQAEVVAREDETTAAIRPALAAWMSTVRSGAPSAQFVQLGLHAGEASLLSVATKEDVLVIDEKQGRALANTLGLTCVGLLGLLLAGARDGRITIGEAQDALEALEHAGFWVTPQLRARFREDLERHAK